MRRRRPRPPPVLFVVQVAGVDIEIPVEPHPYLAGGGDDEYFVSAALARACDIGLVPGGARPVYELAAWDGRGADPTRR